jgi:DNA polymerase-1
MRLASPRAYQLLHEGTLALARVEGNGVKIDEPYLHSTITDVGNRIKDYEKKIREDRLYREWHKLFGEETNLDSREQLGKIVFERMGYAPKILTGTGKYSTDSEAFEHVDHPAVRLYQQAGKLKHLRANYLEGILREVVDGYIHPNYNLNTAITYRSSCNDPNFQNVPVREEDIASIIRKCYVARGPGRCIVEVDFSQIEVRVAACYHKDPTMLKYIRENQDMHLDMAAQIFKIPKELVSKQARRLVKAAFVFAQFYGDYYLKCARSIWHQVEKDHITAKDGTSLFDHLREGGIDRLGACDPKERPEPGTFEYYMKEVEDHFWNVRFPKYGKWKKEWYAEYLENGGFDTLTGFRIDAPLSRNDVINYPVQGSAFHCLLQSLIWLQKAIDNRGMDALLIGQIHDSILADVAVECVPAYVDLARKIMTQKLPAAWDWIITPLEVEVEVAPPGRSWYEKKVYTGTVPA